MVKRLLSLNIFFTFALISLAASSLSAQSPILCNTTATPLMVRAEGLAETVGTLLLSCSGGTAGQTVVANVTALFPTSITNRVNSNGTPDLVITLDTGSGPMPIGNAPVLSATNTVALNNLSVTIPGTRTFTLTLSNVRLAVGLLPPSTNIIASFSSSAFSFNSNNATVATSTIGLLANSSNATITCVGSPSPTTFTVQHFFSAGTAFNSLRVTEGFGTAFIKKDPTADTGTRILIRYTGFPTGARVFLPDYIAGNSATQPTAGGDLGGTQSAGIYTPTAAGTLLLARVIAPDQNGAGGAPIGVASQFAAGPTTLGTVTEVALVGGAALAVYEVIDSNASTQESAQIPTFVTLPQSGNQQVTTANAAVAIGPVSTVSVGTSGDPIPRFRQAVPPSDCTFLGDCSANYFPVLSVGIAFPLTFQVPAQGLQQTSFITVNNANSTTSSPLVYSVAVTYQNGSGYVFVDPPALQGGYYTGNSTLRVILNAAGLTPGTYQASILISAGAAGSRNIPVTVTVAPVAAPTVNVTSVTNAATLTNGPLVAGSLGTLMGTNLAGTSVAVTFDGMPAPILFKNATQINFQVPAVLAAKTSSQLAVIVDGVASAPQTVQLVQAAPGIFGVLNQNGTVNASGVPAAPGSIIQIFATGLATSAFTVNASVNGFPNLIPLYAGDAPGIPGVQQVNVLIPAAVTTGQLNLQICSANLTLNACSPLFALTVR